MVSYINALRLLRGLRTQSSSDTVLRAFALPMGDSLPTWVVTSRVVDCVCMPQKRRITMTKGHSICLTSGLGLLTEFNQVHQYLLQSKLHNESSFMYNLQFSITSFHAYAQNNVEFSSLYSLRVRYASNRIYIAYSSLSSLSTQRYCESTGKSKR
ncbi:hypothetical protein AB6A40_001949 [Gnathostoma spinigerum]|uniref:Uncharacterized protein n=1 Tax=Gnathostoma spinigerum TaxID=75299 RepID=A0ABD6EG09_9BILA